MTVETILRVWTRASVPVQGPRPSTARLRFPLLLQRLPALVLPPPSPPSSYVVWASGRVFFIYSAVLVGWSSLS